jgi:hypothetical protein
MDLKKEKESLISQRDNAFAVYQQTIGAIALIDALLAEETPSVTEKEFKELVGAKEVEFIPVE